MFSIVTLFTQLCRLLSCNLFIPRVSSVCINLLFAYEDVNYAYCVFSMCRASYTAHLVWLVYMYDPRNVLILPTRVQTLFSFFSVVLLCVIYLQLS